MGNLPQTRNNRKAALCTFVRYLARRDPVMIAPCAKIRAIRSKITSDKVIPALSKDEVRAFLAAIPRTSLAGLREACSSCSTIPELGFRQATNLLINDIRLERPFQITLTGKGNKQRIVPLWEETVTAIGKSLKARAHLTNPSLFLNHRGEALTRFGVGWLTKKYLPISTAELPLSP
jgi:integrase/recombinase XerD